MSLWTRAVSHQLCSWPGNLYLPIRATQRTYGEVRATASLSARTGEIHNSRGTAFQCYTFYNLKSFHSHRNTFPWIIACGFKGISQITQRVLHREFCILTVKETYNFFWKIFDFSGWFFSQNFTPWFSEIHRDFYALSFDCKIFFCFFTVLFLFSPSFICRLVFTV